jgi:hypothetical protein
MSFTFLLKKKEREANYVQPANLVSDHQGGGKKIRLGTSGFKKQILTHFHLKTLL